MNLRLYLISFAFQQLNETVEKKTGSENTEGKKKEISDQTYFRHKQS